MYFLETSPHGLIASPVFASNHCFDLLSGTVARIAEPTETPTALTGLYHWCWCRNCTGRRFRKQILETLNDTKHRRRRGSLDTGYRVICDDQIRVLMARNASQWNQIEFGNLWPRILALDTHLQEARPWNLGVLFQDRSDTVQYWTFL